MKLSRLLLIVVLCCSFAFVGWDCDDDPPPAAQTPQ